MTLISEMPSTWDTVLGQSLVSVAWVLLNVSALP